LERPDSRSGSQQHIPSGNILTALNRAAGEVIQFVCVIGYRRPVNQHLPLPDGAQLPPGLASGERSRELAPVERAQRPVNWIAPFVPRTWGTKRMTRTRLAVLIFATWTAVGVFENVPEVIKGIDLYASTPWYACLGKMIEAWAWAILTPMLLIIDKKLHSRSMNIATVVCIFAVLSVPFALMHTYLTAILMYPFEEIWWNPLRRDDYTVYYNGGGWVTYCGAVGILEAVRFYNNFLVTQLQLERVKRSLVESRLNALRLHLEPHFLSNALNAVSSEMEARPRVARSMIANLGILFRRSLDSKETPEISLAQELELLEHYLAIQRVRFGERIDIKVQIEPGALSVRVPTMLLQPLVENAIRHGVEKRRSGGTILVSGSKAGDRLHLCVADDGRGLPRGWKLETSTGHGLRVTRERLAALYPEWGDECLSIERCAGGGTQVKIRIPLRAAEHDRAVD
jgi:two-component sensor histidine kinase